MTSKNIHKALGGLDPQLVLKAAPSGEHKQVKGQKAAWVKWGAAAACFVLAFSMCILPMLDFSESSEPRSMLSLTVYASDGTENGMEIDQSYLNSSFFDQNIFGKDVPVFEFYVAPVEYGEDGDIFERYDIEISYNGKIADEDDEHIRLLFAVPQEGIYGIGRYGIIGWFDEPTDIIVTLKAKESGETVEKMTVHVSYSEADAAYQMILTDLYSTVGKEK